MMFGSNTFTVWRFYVSESTFSELQSQLPDGRYTLISARMTDGWAVLTAAYMAEHGGIVGSYNIVASYDNFHSRTAMPMISALFIVMFALILLIVGSIVIRFRINNDIEESMANIGALKAVGYTSRQIILSIIMQFGLIALIGGVMGILPSLIALPLVTGAIIEPLLALPWNPAFSLSISFASLILILIMVLAFAWLTSRRISKLHPIIALRGGITTHSFNKNPLPLDKTGGSLNLLLALKQLLRNKKQAVMLGIIVGGLTFSATAILTMHYNVNVNMDVFVNTVMGDAPDVSIRLNDADDGQVLRERMASRSDVSSIFGRDVVSLQIDDYIVSTIVLETFSYYSGYSLVSGRFPLIGSEIVLDSIALATMGKGIGDWVTVIDGDYEQEYIITGVVQIMGTFIGMIAIDGLNQVQPDFRFMEFGLYLTGERADTDSFIEAVKAENSDIVTRVSSAHGHVENVLGGIGNLFATLSFVIMFVVVSVVILVLYLIIKTIIVRRKRELGIQKALGFTTLQLMNQIAFNITPTIIFGVMLGAIGGYICFNPMFVALMRGVGIAQANLPVPINWLFMVSISLILLSYAVSMLIAWRVRKISAYALVSE
jgi:putative ABC transport system permease protein